MAYIKLSTGGTAISGGYASNHTYAYDGIIETGIMNANGFVSTQMGSNTLNAYLGYIRSISVKAKQIKIYNAAGYFTAQYPNSVVVKGSNDGGSTWETVQTFTSLNTNKYAWNTLDITEDYWYTTWAVWCNQELGMAFRWGVGELEFWGEEGEAPPNPPSSFYSYIIGGE